MEYTNDKNKEISEQLFKASREGNPDTVKSLVSGTADLCACDADGKSALHFAVESGNMELVRFLTEQGGLDPRWGDCRLETPFGLAHRIFPEAERYFESVCGFTLAESFTNPVQRGMHPDPSVIRVGEDYYMVNSSFVLFPGIPVSHSRDLVHWEQIGYALADREWAEEHMGDMEGGRGIWAADISAFRGRFYVTATLRNNDGQSFKQEQLIMSSDRPEGPYGTPVIFHIPGIDPSLFTDDDGRRYMVLNRAARLLEISEDGTKMLSDPELIWGGSMKHTAEGPHLLKHNGYYYCFLAEGGTGEGHRVTVARSEKLCGPYEDCPYNPILRQTDTAGVLQCTGHGMPVETQDGRWFMVYLCERKLQGKWGMLGRETCLDEMIWTSDGWPVIKNNRKPSLLQRKPFPDQSEETGKKEESRVLPYGGWLSARTVNPQAVKVQEDGTIVLTGCGKDLCEKSCRSFAVRNQPDFDFTCSFVLKNPHKIPDGMETGVVLYYDEKTFIKFGRAGDLAFVTEYYDGSYVRKEEYRCTTEDVDFHVMTEGLKRSFLLGGKTVAEWDVTGICSEGLKKGKRFSSAMYGVYVCGTGTAEWMPGNCSYGS